MQSYVYLLRSKSCWVSVQLTLWLKYTKDCCLSNLLIRVVIHLLCSVENGEVGAVKQIMSSYPHPYGKGFGRKVVRRAPGQILNLDTNKQASEQGAVPV